MLNQMENIYSNIINYNFELPKGQRVILNECQYQNLVYLSSKQTHILNNYEEKWTDQFISIFSFS